MRTGKSVIAMFRSIVSASKNARLPSISKISRRTASRDTSGVPRVRATTNIDGE